MRGARTSFASHHSGIRSGNLGKRVYKELSRWDNHKQTKRVKGQIDIPMKEDTLSKKSYDFKDSQSTQTLKFNSGLLHKASAAVDLVTQKIEFKNLMNQSVTGSFVTVILELTPDFITKLEKQEQQIIQEQVQIATSTTGESFENLNIKFIKPSPHFYNKIMSLWFKFNHLQTLSATYGSDNCLQNMLLPQIKALFFDFCVKQFRQVGSWNDQLHKPLENFVAIIA